MKSHKALETEAKAAGFSPVRESRHGRIWRDEYGQTVIIPRAATQGPRSFANTMADIKRAVKNRPAERQEKVKPLTHKPFERIPPPPKPQRGQTHRRYTLEQRAAIMARMKEIWVHSPISVMDMTTRLRVEGYEGPNGGVIKPVTVRRFMSVLGMNAPAEKSAPPKPVPPPQAAPPEPPKSPPQTALPQWALGILTDPDLPDSTKVRMLIAGSEA